MITGRLKNVARSILPGAVCTVCMASTWLALIHFAAPPDLPRAVTPGSRIREVVYPGRSAAPEKRSDQPKRKAESGKPTNKEQPEQKRPATKPPVNPNWKFNRVTAVSSQFLQVMQRENGSIPKNVWQGLDRAGWRLQVAEFVVDAVPSLKGHRPRNWPRGMTWENTDALHMPKTRQVVLAEKRKTRSGKIVANSRVGGTLRHEVGHAFDMAAAREFRFCSAHPDFLVAYHRDTAALNEADRAELAYYINHTQAGRQETFAEAFALVLGGGSDQRHQQLFRRCFPQVIRYVKNCIGNFRPRQITAARENRERE